METHVLIEILPTMAVSTSFPGATSLLVVPVEKELTWNLAGARRGIDIKRCTIITCCGYRNGALSKWRTMIGQSVVEGTVLLITNALTKLGVEIIPGKLLKVGSSLFLVAHGKTFPMLKVDGHKFAVFNFSYEQAPEHAFTDFFLEIAEDSAPCVHEISQVLLSLSL